MRGLTRGAGFRGARAFCALVLAFRRNELPDGWQPVDARAFNESRATKVRGGGTPPPTRRMRALPRVPAAASDFPTP